MPREMLDRHIRRLLDELLILGSMVENSTLGAVQALKERNMEAAKQYYKDDQLINKKRFEIENTTIATLATQQPIMAGDLRMLASILDVTTEIERMGDYAKGIAKICLMLENDPLIKPGPTPWTPTSSWASTPTSGSTCQPRRCCTPWATARSAC